MISFQTNHWSKLPEFTNALFGTFKATAHISYVITWQRSWLNAFYCTAYVDVRTCLTQRSQLCVLAVKQTKNKHTGSWVFTCVTSQQRLQIKNNLRRASAAKSRTITPPWWQTPDIGTHAWSTEWEEGTQDLWGSPEVNMEICFCDALPASWVMWSVDRPHLACRQPCCCDAQQIRWKCDKGPVSVPCLLPYGILLCWTNLFSTDWNAGSLMGLQTHHHHFTYACMHVYERDEFPLWVYYQVMLSGKLFRNRNKRLENGFHPGLKVTDEANKEMRTSYSINVLYIC